MDSITVRVKKYIGANKNPSQFFACFMHVSQKEEIKQVRGDMYTTVSLVLPEGHNAADIINNILDKIEEKYFSSIGGGIINVLEISLKAGYDSFIHYIEDHDIAEATFDLSAVIIWGDIVYIGRIGKAGLYLLRKHRVVNITESLIEIDDYKPISVASGVFYPQDTFILCTPKASEVITNWQHITEMDEPQIEDYVTNIGVQEGISFLFVQIVQTVNIPEEGPSYREELPEREDAILETSREKQDKEEEHLDGKRKPSLSSVDFQKILATIKVVVVRILLLIISLIKKLLEIVKKKSSQARKR